MKLKNKKLRIKYHNSILLIDYFIRKGEETPLIYLHGLGCSKKDFEGALVFSGLKDNTLMAFDFPGCGNSSYPKGFHLNMDDLVNITELVVSKLNLKNFIIVGHSMGGLVALLYAEKRKGKFKGFINVEGNLASEDCFFSREVVGHSFKEFKAKIFPSIIKRVEQRQNKGFQKYFNHLRKMESTAYYDYCPSMTYYSDKGNLIARFLKFKIPKLFIYGSENKKLSYIQYLKQEGCRVVEIPKSNHWPGYDNPQYFYRIIGDFSRNTTIFSKTL